MIRIALSRQVRRLLDGITFRRMGLIALGAMIATFGIHNIHQQTGITEGGVIGLMLFVEHWLGVSPAFITPVLELTCYLLAFKIWAGGSSKFPPCPPSASPSFISCGSSSRPCCPTCRAIPLAAAVLGALFVGIGVGIIVRQGGSSGGDDALALTIARVTRWRLARCYLFTRPGSADAVPQLYPGAADRLFPW